MDINVETRTRLINELEQVYLNLAQMAYNEKFIAKRDCRPQNIACEELPTNINFRKITAPDITNTFPEGHKLGKDNEMRPLVPFKKTSINF